MDQILSQMVFLPINAFEKEIKKQFGVSFDFQLFSKKSIYNAVEYAIASFGLQENMEAHLNAFLDEIYEFNSRDQVSFLSYLQYWEKKGKDQKIVIPEGTNAVKIMTIHKAKGLEFPVVVLPFTSEELVSSQIRKVWYPINNHFDTPFEWGRVHFSSKLKYLGDKAIAFYNEQVVAERGDALNTLYVAFTRAVSQMYIICGLESQKAPMDKSYATLLNHFVRTKNQEPEIEIPFQWGTAQKQIQDKAKIEINTIQPDFKIQPNWQKRLWVQIHSKHDDTRLAAIGEGLLIHDLLAEVSFAMDVPDVVAGALLSGKINHQEYNHYLQMLKNIVDHPQLSPYYQEGVEVYNEKDILGGDDPYSASKAGAEILFNSYFQSFFKSKKNIKMASARAGNVIGGGDWASNRLVPDVVRSLLKEDTLKIRYPDAIRPWQHVLEPLFGYLSLAKKMYESDRNSKYNSPFNFGPYISSNKKVKELVYEILKTWSGDWVETEKSDTNIHEANKLNLVIDKAINLLDWEPKWCFEKTVEKTVTWYKSYYNDKENALNYCIKDIEDFLEE